jgi:hypothetical protein
VIHDNIEDDVDPAFVRSFRQLAQTAEPAQMRADRREIERSITVPRA